MYVDGGVTGLHAPAVIFCRGPDSVNPGAATGPPNLVRRGGLRLPYGCDDSHLFRPSFFA